MTPRLATAAFRGAAIIAGLYLLVLLAVSLTSRERLLPASGVQRFCGFYLDCHRMVTVASVRFADTVAGHRAEGRYAIITVVLSSDATGVTLRSGHLEATLRGADGQSFRRVDAVERSLAAVGTPAGLPNVPLPAGVRVPSSIVFDVRADHARLRLRVRDAGLFARLSEFFLVGDGDSFLHARTWFVLEQPLAARVPPSGRLCDATAGCDTVVRVLEVVRARRAGPPARRVPADGVFYLVTLAVTDADSGAPRAVPLIAEIRDAAGRSYGRAHDVEAVLPDGSPGVVSMAFDLPDDILAPQLVLRRSGLVNRVLHPVRLPLDRWPS